MTFTDPIDFDSAIQVLQDKKILPTALTSAQIGQLRDQFNLRGMFSSRTLNAQLLGGYQDQLATRAGGKTDMATARLTIKQLIARLGDRALAAEPGKEGTLEDFGSDARINLVLKTNLSMARGFGQWLEGNSEGALLAFPALELVRGAERAVPRGFIKRHKVLEEDPDDGWPARWAAALEACGMDDGATDGTDRMVALKNHPIWQALGDGAGGYDDGLGNPFPPFAFNSGMVLEDVDYEDACDLGVMEPEDDPLQPADPDRDFNAGAAASVANLAAPLVKVLADDLQGIATQVGDAFRMVTPTPSLANSAAVLRNRARHVLALLDNAGAPDEPRIPRGEPDAGEWTSDGGSAKMDEHGRLATRGAQEDGGDSTAEQVITRELGRGEEAGPRAYGQADLLARDARQKEVLRRLAPQFPVAPTSARTLSQGAEHVVELAPDKSRVLKFTRGDAYGTVLHGYAAPLGHFADLREATPGEYAERLRLHNEVFGTDNRIKGLSTTGRGSLAPSLVSSQSFLRGTKPQEPEVGEFMRAKGFLPVSPDHLANAHIEQTTWYHPKLKIVASDAKPSNFVKGADKHLTPIDLIVQHAPAGSALRGAMEEGVRRAGARLDNSAPVTAAQWRQHVAHALDLLQEAACT